MEIRVRFAPSPTGYLHIGGARTALFNWLFARHNRGKFILRIEDTDEVRSTIESVKAIVDSLSWLGLNWDEGPEIVADIKGNLSFQSRGEFGPYFQMERQKQGIYQEFAQKLIDSGWAYYCYCRPEELQAKRELAMKNKIPPKYDGTCRTLTEEQIGEKRAAGIKPVLRFKMPRQGQIEFTDIIRGTLQFENALLDDFVLLKASGVPTYNFACVIDDYLMKISHVIRGDDHLSNTPRQVHLYQALNLAMPRFAHLSMILGPDGARLSKRHGHTSVLEYVRDGYLPEALLNYLALLGWSTEDSQQIFSEKELVEKFSLERCGKSPAIFDGQKLLWMNAEYIRQKSPSELTRLFRNWVRDQNPGTEIDNWDEKKLEMAIAAEQEKIKLLRDIPGLVDFFFANKIEYNEEAKKILKGDGVNLILQELTGIFKTLPEFSAANLEKVVRQYCAEKKYKTGQVFHPLRAAVSGRTKGPHLFVMLEILGKNKVIESLENLH